MDRSEIRKEAESLIWELYCVPTGSNSDEPEAVAAVLEVVREMGLAAFTDEAIERLVEAQKDILGAEMRMGAMPLRLPRLEVCSGPTVRVNMPETRPKEPPPCPHQPSGT
jgi:hypothetical protein